MMKKLGAALACVLLLGQAAMAVEVRDLRSRHGDNAISFHWNDESAHAAHAESSRRLRANQKIELLTRLVQRRDIIIMRAVLRNISQRRTYRIDGRLVHKIWQDGTIVKKIETKVFHVAIGPGDKVIGKFSYTLPTGDYYARTDYKRA